MTLTINESHALDVAARASSVASGVQVEPDQRYHLSAAGMWCDTKAHCCTADGYASGANAVLRVSERWRRVRAAPWFVLVAAVGLDHRQATAVGADGTFAPESSGELHFFANDVPFMYFNNSGSVVVTVTRIR